MASKGQFDRTMGWLKKLFAADPEALVAVELLKEHGQELAWETATETRPLTLPTDFSAAEYDFAVFTDGACRGNPGPGAWAALIQDNTGGVVLESTGVETLTTNNRMEIEAVIQGLSSLLGHIGEAPIPPRAAVYSDSRYVIDGITQWVPNWKARGWRKADNKTPENLEWWQRLELLQKEFSRIDYIWVRGHAGHPQNEHCDRLANVALNEAGL